MNLFQRHISARVADYAWAYRLRIGALGGSDPTRLLHGVRRPVLLLPGVYETWHFLEAVGLHLNQQGHPVHVVPTFGRNLRPILEMAALAGDYVEQHDLTNVAIVAHSKGGLIGKSLMVADDRGSRIASMVAINTPFAGSDYAHLIPIRTLREFVPTHETIVTLAGNAAVDRHITSIFSSWDPIIPNGSVLEGATNIELPITGHFRILDRPDLLAAVERAVSSP
jgi:triacylglycerol esterase/lipase EstA (alpha/beta hydrolase family)